ncbi:hypothetical protein MMC19_007256 [Ptychographa xylographoides]|nr:hypothetical protein [Ptychographa xylographoides]
MSFEQLLRSPMFTFIVGSDKVPFMIHSAAVAQQSQTLDSLLNGPMLESQERCASFNEVQTETFSLFCQFAYTGDYETPLCTIAEAFVESDGFETTVVSAEAASDTSTELAILKESRPSVLRPENTGWGEWGISSKDPKKPSRKTLLPESFKNKKYTPTVSRQLFADACEVKPNNGPHEDYTSVFLTHARLYVFAEKYRVQPLKTLTLYKVHKTLFAFTLYKQRIGDVIKLIKYVYSDDNTPNKEDQIDRLRELLILYVVCEIDILSQSEEFLSLLECGGSFVRDFWK